MTDKRPQLDDRIVNSILLTIEEGVTIYDTNFKLIAWNGRYAAMGITPAEKIRLGLSIEETYQLAAEAGVFGAGDPTGIAKERIAAVYSATSPNVEDLFGVGGKIIEVRRYFLPDVGVAAIFSDVTEARQSAAKLKRTEALESLARLTAGFAHDFSNVLQAVTANLQLALASGDRRHVKIALQATWNGADLAKCLLDLGRPNKHEEHFEFDAISAIEATIRWIERVLRSNITLEFDSNIESATVNANQGRFAISLVNLILNAQDAMPDGGRVRVSVGFSERHTGHLFLSVEDNGFGMSDELIGNASEPFFSTKGDNGTGLGLSEVQSFVDSVDGRFEIKSTLGVGSRLTMFMPATAEPSLGPSKPSSVEPISLRVLFVEDNMDVQKPFQKLVNSMGCQTHCVCSVEQAIDLLEAVPHDFFDLVITDYLLAGVLTGADLARKVKTDLGQPPVVLLTTNPAQHEHESTAVCVLRKPVEFQDLYELLRKFD
jgi:signal transduction histidine kinase/CheY-like chemotaxis protein